MFYKANALWLFNLMIMSLASSFTVPIHCPVYLLMKSASQRMILSMIDAIMSLLPASMTIYMHLDEYCRQQSVDASYSKLKVSCTRGWDKEIGNLSKHWKVRGELMSQMISFYMVPILLPLRVYTNTHKSTPKP